MKIIKTENGFDLYFENEPILPILDFLDSFHFESKGQMVISNIFENKNFGRIIKTGIRLKILDKSIGPELETFILPRLIFEVL